MSSDTEGKYCVGCKHYRAIKHLWAFGDYTAMHVCLRHVQAVPDPITGEKCESGHLDCVKERDVSGACGPNGELWESKL